jgi:hypothetical protein
LPAGIYTITATFAGDGYCNPASATATLIQLKATTSITVSSLTLSYKQSGIIYATLTTQTNQDFAHKEIEFRVANQFIGTSSTNQEGVATISYTCYLPARIYTITASFGGDRYYEASSATATLTQERAPTKLTLEDVPKYIQKEEDLLIKANLMYLIDDVEEAIEGATMTFTINSWSTQTLTNEDGVASATYHCGTLGAYTIVAKFSGDDYFEACSKTATFKVIYVGTITPNEEGSITISFEEINGTITINLPDDWGAGTFTVGVSDVDIPDLPSGYKAVENAVFKAEIDGIVTATFTLTFYYAEENLPEGVDEEDIKIFKLVDGEWMELPCEVDADNNCVIVELTSLSIFRLGVKTIASIQDLSAKALSSVAVKLTWSLSEGDADKIEIVREEVGIGSVTLTSDLATTTTQYKDTGLKPNTQYRYWLRVWYGEDASDWTTITTKTRSLIKALIPYNNLFKPKEGEVCSIGYKVNQAGRVLIKIYNLAGELVRTLVDEHKEAGEYIKPWDGRNDAGKLCAAGVYVILYNAKEIKEIEKVILIK